MHPYRAIELGQAYVRAGNRPDLRHLVLAAGVTLGAVLCFDFLGLRGLAGLVAGSVSLILLVTFMTRNMAVAATLWLFLSMPVFRILSIVGMPALPDFSLDRLILILLTVIFLAQFVLGKRRLMAPYAADVLLFMHMSYILFHILYTAPKHFNAWMMSSLPAFLGFLVGKYAITNQKNLRYLVYFFLAMSVYFYVESIGQHMGWNWLIWPKAIVTMRDRGLWHEGRTRGPVMHPPLFGQMQAMFLIVHVYLLSRPYRFWIRAGLAVSFVLSLLGLFFNFTRAPYVAAVAGLATTAALRPRFRRVLAVAVVAALLGASVGVLQMANSDFFQERMATTGTIDNRLGMLANAMRMLQDHPVFGIGFFMANENLWRYNEGTYIPLYGYVKKRAGGDVVPHDIYIGRMAEEGIISGLLLLAFSVTVIRMFLRKWRLDPREDWFNRDLLALFAGIMVCYLVGGMGIDYRYFNTINTIFFLLAGIIYGYGNRRYGIS